MIHDVSTTEEFHRSELDRSHFERTYVEPQFQTVATGPTKFAHHLAVNTRHQKTHSIAVGEEIGEIVHRTGFCYKTKSCTFLFHTAREHAYVVFGNFRSSPDPTIR